MRSPLGLIGLVLALVVVALLARQALRPKPVAPVSGGSTQETSATNDVRARSDQVQQQVQKGLDDAFEAARRQREAADQ